MQRAARTADLHLRVSPPELSLIQEGAAADERMVSDWARRVLLAEAQRARANGKRGGRPRKEAP